MWQSDKMHCSAGILLVIGLNFLVAKCSHATLVWDELVASRIRGAQIEDMSGSTDIGIGDLHWNASRMYIVVFDEFCSNLSTLPAGGVGFGFQVGTIVVTGEWNYTVDSVVNDERTGEFNVSIDGLSLGLYLTMGNGPNNTWIDCNTRVAAVAVEFHGEDSWYANFFHETVEEQIQQQLEVSMCTGIQSSVEGFIIKLISWIAAVLAATIAILIIYRKFHGSTLHIKSSDRHRGWIYEKLIPHSKKRKNRSEKMKL